MDDAGDEVAAGNFSSWVEDLQEALRGEHPSVVPCAGCTACCTSSQFVLIGPDETETLRRIPKDLLFPAPGQPPGYLVLGYDEQGHCPMLIDYRCSIYEHRPKTCRTYDCRVFAAAGLDPGEGKAAISDRVRRWRFEAPAAEDRARQRAIRAAAAFLERHRSTLPDGAVSSGATQLAVLAFEVHHLFMEGHDPDLEAVRSELARLRKSHK